MSGVRFDPDHWADGPELMDSPAVSWEDFRDAVEDLALSNRLLGGIAPILAACGDLARVAAQDGRRPVTFLDVGCGGGDVALALARWARSARLDARVLAVDVSPHAVRHARDTCRDEPWVSVVQADAFALPFPEGLVDVVHAGQVLHHVERADQPAFVRRLAELATTGMVISDLRRTRFAFHGVTLFGKLTGRRRLFLNDGPLSVARAFTMAEARELARASGVEGIRVERHAFSRLTWVRGPVALA